MIDTFKVENFKSIKKADIKFGRFNVLVGLNGAGKTNFLQALNFLKRLAMGYEISDAAEAVELHTGDMFCRKGASNKIKLSAVLKTEEDIAYQIDIELLKILTNDIEKIIVSSEILQKISRDVKISETIYERDKEAHLTSKGEAIPLDVELDELALGKYLDVDAKVVKDIFRNIYIPDSSLIESRESIARINNRNLAGLLVRLKEENPNEFEKFRKIIKKLIPSFSNIVDIPARYSRAKQSADTQPLTPHFVQLQEEEIEGLISMRALSLGDVRTLYFIAAIILYPDNSTFVIEEIENGMHPKRVVDLIDRLETISRSKDIQIIFTTHSPALINKQSVENILYIEKTNGETSIIAYRTSENLQKIQDVLNEGGKITDFIYERR